MSRKFSIYLLVTSSLLFWRKEYINIEEPLYIYTNLYLTSWRAQCCPWTLENLSIHPHTHTHTRKVHTHENFRGLDAKMAVLDSQRYPWNLYLMSFCSRNAQVRNSCQRKIQIINIYIKYTLDLTKVLILPLWIGNCNLCTKGHLKLRLQSL